jgi:hypothetical protein
MTTTKRLLLIATLALAACENSSGPFSPNERRELSNAESRWQASRPAHYAYEYQVECFCGYAGIWARLEVRGDSVVAATEVNPQPGAPPLPLSYWPTVNGLFAQLHAITENAGGNYLKDLSADYDPAWGYPVRIDMTCTDQVADCGEHAEARNLQSLP